MMFADNHIVTRLRLWASAVPEKDAVIDELHNAADEIEWLHEWKELAYEMRNKYWWFMRAKTLKKFDQMHKKDWKRNGL